MELLIAHDYQRPRRGWGHDLSFQPTADGLTAEATGWGCSRCGKINAGDLLVLTHPKTGRPVPYRVSEIRYESDPRDMWHAKLEWQQGQIEVQFCQDKWSEHWKRIADCVKALATGR